LESQDNLWKSRGQYGYGLVSDFHFRFHKSLARLAIMRRPPRIVVQLVHIQGPLMGQIQEFDQELITVGRDPSSHVLFPRDLNIVSRKHAEIQREGNRFKLIDHSSNGTLVNGKKTQEAFLKDGDVLTFAEGGPKVSFLTQIQDDAAAEEETERPTPRVRTEEPRPPAVEFKSAVPEAPFRPPVESAPVRPAPGKPEPVEVKSVMVPLTVQYGPTLRSFKGLPVVIGRHPRSDFVLDHAEVLDQHVQIFFSQDAYWVKDLTGLQHVRVNGKPIVTQISLQPHDELALTANGPFFLFLGGGRLAEKEGPGGGESLDARQPDERQQKAPSSAEGQEKKSFFKKILGH
jgi:pSer/pThr/pTyr-binding forkhead associated (FHA) protein